MGLVLDDTEGEGRNWLDLLSACDNRRSLGEVGRERGERLLRRQAGGCGNGRLLLRRRSTMTKDAVATMDGYVATARLRRRIAQLRRHDGSIE